MRNRKTICPWSDIIRDILETRERDTGSSFKNKNSLLCNTKEPYPLFPEKGYKLVSIFSLHPSSFSCRVIINILIHFQPMRVTQFVALSDFPFVQH